ncbi:UNVERIFIED_CONTAM: hypothetical protein Slati_0872000 [Sesamum latifolium]|uniref:Uncharacterized protein n=1 Tax=Sesamum latifolium TaxID=2727402 RepID=A0AAW2XN65_9LAMI
MASMTNNIQKQYDRLDDVPLIMLRMKEVYAVLDRHIRYAVTKAFFGTKMAERSSVHSHGIKMLSLVKKLKDLTVGLNNDTYIDVILQPLHPFYDPFIINYNMNGLEKSINKLINMLKRKKGKGKAIAATTSAEGAPAAPVGKGKGKGKVGDSQSRGQMMSACIAKERGIGRGSAQLPSNPGMFVIEVNMTTNAASWVLDTGYGAHICNYL